MTPQLNGHLRFQYLGNEADNRDMLYSELGVLPLEQESFNYYRKNTMSIEIIKDDSLQKINFRVKNKVIHSVIHSFVNSFELRVHDCSVYSVV